MNISISLHDGPADGEFLTLHADSPPNQLRVAPIEPDGSDKVEVALYSLLHVEELPVSLRMFAAAYEYQGTKPSAWSLVDFSVVR